MPQNTRRANLLTSALAVTAVCLACSASPSGPSTGGTGGDHPASTGQTAIVLGVGDIGMCNRPAVAQTARLVAGLEGLLLLAGDIAYFQGSAADFRDCFNPEWGRFRDRWYATPGNHEYESPGAGPYFDYFAEAAGSDRSGYYAIMAGDWLVLMLNSNIPAARGSAQWEFARQQLEAQRTPCTMAVWHHPLFTSGPSGGSANMRDMWSLLEAARAEIVLNGHDHLYERFARQQSNGTADPANGIRQFTAGTGGAELYDFVRAAPNSESRIMRYGVIRFTLRPAIVEWAFLGIDGSVNDSGLDTCR
jgi:hypothetical protein